MEIFDNLEKDQAVATVLHAAGNLAMHVDALEVRDTQTEAEATDVLAQIKGHIKTVEERRKYYTAPMNEVIRALNASARTVREPLEKMERAVKNKMTEYHAELEKKRREEERKRIEKERKIQEDLAKADTFEAVEKAQRKQERLEAKAMTEVNTKIKTNGSTASYKTTWAFDVVDEMKIPREYLAVDTVKIGKLVRAGLREIPGVRIYEKKQLAVR